MAHQTKSKDGTLIAYEKSGRGPAVVIVGGVMGDRSQQAPLASALESQFTVYNYDRRGHGESGNTEPYAVDREIEDLDAILEQAGGTAYVYGTSGCAVLALHAAAGGSGSKMQKLAIWEPPFIVDDSRPNVRADYKQNLSSLLAQGRRGEMAESFFSDAVGMPAEFVAQMRQSPWWPAQEAVAHTLIYDATLMGDYSMPRATIAKVKVPTLVIDGGQTPWLRHAADAVAATLPNAQRSTIEGQPHNVDHNAIAPVLIDYFRSK
jgi:pimeloyl-ACP methyl ester carboxylesterase